MPLGHFDRPQIGSPERSNPQSSNYIIDWWSPTRPHKKESQTNKQNPSDGDIPTRNRFSPLENLSDTTQKKDVPKRREQTRSIRDTHKEEPRTEQMEFPPLPNTSSTNVDKFITMKIEGNVKNKEKIFRELKAKANLDRGDITEIRDGSLLIKTRSPITTGKLLKVNKILNYEVRTNINERLSQTRCTIYATGLMQLSEAELLEDFADRGIVAVKRFKKRTEGGITDTPIHLLTFDSLNPPTHIYHGWVKYYTRRYIPKPRQCFKCFKFGHIAGVCRGLEQLCINCATTGHKPTECKNETRCSQCGEGHISTSRNCKHFKLHNRTQELKEIKRLSHKDAFIQA